MKMRNQHLSLKDTFHKAIPRYLFPLTNRMGSISFPHSDSTNRMGSTHIMLNTVHPCFRTSPVRYILTKKNQSCPLFIRYFLRHRTMPSVKFPKKDSPPQRQDLKYRTIICEMTKRTIGVRYFWQLRTSPCPLFYWPQDYQSAIFLPNIDSPQIVRYWLSAIRQ